MTTRIGEGTSWIGLLARSTPTGGQGDRVELAVALLPETGTVDGPRLRVASPVAARRAVYLASVHGWDARLELRCVPGRRRVPVADVVVASSAARSLTDALLRARRHLADPRFVRRWCDASARELSAALWRASLLTQVVKFRRLSGTLLVRTATRERAHALSAAAAVLHMPATRLPVTRRELGYRFTVDVHDVLEHLLPPHSSPRPPSRGQDVEMPAHLVKGGR